MADSAPPGSARNMARLLNLALLIAFPIAWHAPLLRTGLLPEWQMPGWLGGSTLFELETLTVLSGLQALWGTDRGLALVVTFFALVAPLLKVLGVALIQFGVLGAPAKEPVRILGKLAMADIFLIALYVVIAKGIGVGQVEVAWGLYLFTACVLTSLGLSLSSRPAA